MRKASEPEMSREMAEMEEEQERLETEPLPQMELLENNWPLLLLQTINVFRINGTGCDVVLVTEEGSTLEAHSLVLKAGSPYFKQVCSHALNAV